MTCERLHFEQIQDILRVLSGPGGKLALSPAQRSVGAVFETRRHELVLAWTGDDPRTRITIEREAAAAGLQVSRRMLANSELLRVIYDNAGRNHVRGGQLDETDKGEPRRLIDQIVSRALNLGASDIHMQVEETHATVAFRVHGDMVPFGERLTRRLGDQLAITLWNMKDASSAADEFRRATYQQCRIEGDFQFGSPAGAETVRAQLRFQSAPMKGDAFKVVMRLQSRAHGIVHRDLQGCGYTPEQRVALEMAAMASDGLVLVSGPVNSGKTVTLGALGQFQVAVYGQRKVIATVEDPIELSIPGACQHPVVGTDGRGFDDAVLSALRQDVNTVILGEIRTASTAAICRKAAETGHLIMSSVHATDAWTTLTRTVKLGIEMDKLGEPGFLRAICNQRLLPSLCSHCALGADQKAGTPLFALQLERMRRTLASAVAWDHLRFKNHEGCARCQGGATGLRLVSEILVPDDTLCVLLQGGELREAREYWCSGELSVSMGLPATNAYASAFALMCSGHACPFDVEHRFGPLHMPRLPERKATLAVVAR
ncbi:MAG: Flp pilus assembly complex ATPase component TadA [Ahniella sp.]|nr:Flp pilus assembly complex ATPase component TadA [Ahniella sp.]